MALTYSFSCISCILWVGLANSGDIWKIFHLPPPIEWKDFHILRYYRKKRKTHLILRLHPCICKPFCSCVPGRSRVAGTQIMWNPIAGFRMDDNKKFNPDPSLKLTDQVRQVLRYYHYRYNTEETYCDWILRYILFHGGKTHPKDMGKTEIEAFLSHLSTNRRISASRRNRRWIR